MRDIRGFADEPITYGARVICRGGKVSLANPDIANGRARARPIWASTPAMRYETGEHLLVEPIEGLGERNLHAMANAPLMDASNLYLPAGRLSMADYRARVAADVVDQSIEEPRP